MEANRLPRAAAPACAVQDGTEGLIKRIDIFTVEILPPPRHAGADRAAERAAPDALSQSTQIGIVRARPAAIVDAEFADHYGLLVTREKRLRDRGQPARGAGLVVGMVSGEVELGERPDFRAVAAAG